MYFSTLEECAWEYYDIGRSVCLTMRNIKAYHFVGLRWYLPAPCLIDGDETKQDSRCGYFAFILSLLAFVSGHIVFTTS